MCFLSSKSVETAGWKVIKTQPWDLDISILWILKCKRVGNHFSIRKRGVHLWIFKFYWCDLARKWHMSSFLSQKTKLTCIDGSKKLQEAPVSNFWAICNVSNFLSNVSFYRYVPKFPWERNGCQFRGKKQMSKKRELPETQSAYFHSLFLTWFSVYHIYHFIYKLTSLQVAYFSSVFTQSCFKMCLFDDLSSKCKLSKLTVPENGYILPRFWVSMGTKRENTALFYINSARLSNIHLLKTTTEDEKGLRLFLSKNQATDKITPNGFTIK